MALKDDILVEAANGLTTDEIMLKLAVSRTYVNLTKRDNNPKSKPKTNNRTSDNMTYEEIGEVLDIKPRTVINICNGALAKMKVHMELMGVDVESMKIFSDYQDYLGDV